MGRHDRTVSRRALTRRAALLLPTAAALSGCSIFDDLFFSDKPPLPGTRLAVMAGRRGLSVDPEYHPRIAVPPPTETTTWSQPGGTASHDGGHPALPDTLRQAWRSNIGEGGGYRRKITAQPVIAGGRVFSMDSDGVVRAYDIITGARVWSFETRGEDDRNDNLGGGISAGADTLYAATGRGELVALDLASGKQRWRQPLGAAARAAGTIAERMIFVPTLDDRMVAFAADDGHRLWSYQANNVGTSVLGLPSPAYADGIVVGGFGSGDLVALRAASGSVAWTDSLASGAGRTSIADLPSVRGRPVIVNGQVYATSLGELTVALDLRTGRRIWERDFGSYESPYLAGDWLFMVSDDQLAACVSRLDGKVAWATQLPRWNNEEKQRDPIVWHGPVLAGDRLLFAGSNTQAMAVSPYTGKILGTQELGDKGALAPVVAGGTAYFVSDDGSLVALR